MGYFVECVKDIKNQIPKEWKYTGYGNDMCPSYSFNNLKVFIDHLDPKKREDQTLSRFSITDDNEESDNYQMIIFETEKFEEVLKYMDQALATREPVLYKNLTFKENE